MTLNNWQTDLLSRLYDRIGNHDAKLIEHRLDSLEKLSRATLDSINALNTTISEERIHGRQLDKKIGEHELSLRGRAGNNGLQAEVRDLKKNQQFTSKLAWSILTVVIGLVVHSLWNNYSKPEDGKRTEPAKTAKP